MNRKYPFSLFLTGFVLNLATRYFYLLIPAIIFMIIGIWIDPCFVIGMAIFCLDIVVSLINQLIYKHTIENSDNPDFAPFQQGVMSNDWIDNVKDLLEEAMETEDQEEDQEADEDD